MPFIILILIENKFIYQRNEPFENWKHYILLPRLEHALLCLDWQWPCEDHNFCSHPASKTNSMDGEANSSSATQDIPRILWNRKVYSHIHKSPPPIPMLSQINSLHARSQASAAVYHNSSVFWVIMQRKLVKHRRFGTTYRSHLQGSSVQVEHLHTSSFNMEMKGCPETSVLNQSTLSNDPEDRRIQSRPCLSTLLPKNPF
jgi:hypothetical protein